MTSDGGRSGRRRRAVLARSALALAGVGLLAGCSSGTDDGSGSTTPNSGTGATTADGGVGGVTTTGSTGTETRSDGDATTTATDSAATTTPEPTTTTSAEPTVVELAATVGGWRGRQPDAIDGETNPTLRLRAGERYEIRWLNLDGERHQLVLVDGDGAAVATSEPSSEQGATRVLQVEVTEAVAAYRCTFHSGSMQGSVQTGPPGTSRRGTAEGNGTAGSSGRAESNGTAGSDGAERATAVGVD